jgi:hypothetical protein
MAQLDPHQQPTAEASHHASADNRTSTAAASSPVEFALYEYQAVYPFCPHCHEEWRESPYDHRVGEGQGRQQRLLLLAEDVRRILLLAVE